jgi:dienelactone hydrolase
MVSPRVLAAVAACCLVLGAGCSSSGTGSASPPPPYQHKGPDPVGVTTLDLGSAGPVFGERLATVYYPADPAHLTGHAPFSYPEASTLPASYQAILPAKYNQVTTIDAFTDPPASRKGPFPIVLFSHGDGGQRVLYSSLLAGIASWGYVVVSADYLERGLAAYVLQTKQHSTPAHDSVVMASSLAAVEQASQNPTSVLYASSDPSRVAAVGHSSGGGTAFDALDGTQVATAVGWAPVPPTGTPSTKPVMLIGAEGDTVVPASQVRSTFDAFQGPKVLVEISGEGHNTYTDICTGIRSGIGLIPYALSQHFVSAANAAFAINGCRNSDLPPSRFWPVVQFYTVLQLHNVFQHEATATIPTHAAGQFPGFTVTVTQSS